MDKTEAETVIEILEQAEDALHLIAENDKLRAAIQHALTWRDLYGSGIPDDVAQMLTKLLKEI